MRIARGLGTITLLTGVLPGCFSSSPGAETSCHDPPAVLLETSDGTPICSATVEARSGGYMETLQPASTAADAADCGRYKFAGNSGSFAVTISAPGYEPADFTVRIIRERCGFSMERLDTRDMFESTVPIVMVPE